jgi:hypothetical protein
MNKLIKLTIKSTIKYLIYKNRPIDHKEKVKNRIGKKNHNVKKDIISNERTKKRLK